MSYVQLFFIESMMDSVLTIKPEGPHFKTYAEAAFFFKEGHYAEKSHGSTEDHSEYKIMEVKNGKVYHYGNAEPMKRNATTKNGDFVVQQDKDGADSVSVETINGIESLTWRDESY